MPTSKYTDADRTRAAKMVVAPVEAELGPCPPEILAEQAKEFTDADLDSILGHADKHAAKRNAK